MTTELVFVFHKNITKLVFLWPNMGQKTFKVLKSNIICYNVWWSISICNILLLWNVIFLWNISVMIKRISSKKYLSRKFLYSLYYLLSWILETFPTLFIISYIIYYILHYLLFPTLFIISYIYNFINYLSFHTLFIISYIIYHLIHLYIVLYII